MTFPIIITISVVVLIFLFLALSSIPADMVLFAGLMALILGGVITVEQGLKGFSNSGMLTVGILFVIAAAIQNAGGIDLISSKFLRRTKSIAKAQMQIMVPTIVLSAFLNNTTVVAMFIPAITEWAKKNGLPVSKLLLPLSYTAIFGGVCTLIGTSTNLVVSGMLSEKLGYQAIGMFDITLVGLACAIAGSAYLMIFSRWLLPNRENLATKLDDPREYTVEMVVTDNSPLIGKTIEQAGLRHLPGLFLMEILRGDHVIHAAPPSEFLESADRLVFVGIVDSVVDLYKIKGLAPATEQVYKIDAPKYHRSLIEAVVSNECPLTGKSIRDGKFRSHYDAVVIAVARNGARLNQRIGDIILHEGDTLLLEAHESFLIRQKNSKSFFLVSRVDGYTPMQHEKAPLAIGILLLMVIAAATGFMSMLMAGAIASGTLLLTRCISGAQARRSIDLQVLFAIIAAFGIGEALKSSGAAPLIAESLLSISGENPLVALAVIYGITSLFTELITNNAAAVLVFPIAISTAEKLGVSFMPFIIALMIAASASFATPIGYQTNLMVYGPGGYTFKDFMKIGIPLNILLMIISIGVIPLVWSF